MILKWEAGSIFGKHYTKLLQIPNIGANIRKSSLPFSCPIIEGKSKTQEKISSPVPIIEGKEKLKKKPRSHFPPQIQTKT